MILLNKKTVLTAFIAGAMALSQTAFAGSSVGTSKWMPTDDGSSEGVSYNESVSVGHGFMLDDRVSANNLNKAGWSNYQDGVKYTGLIVDCRGMNLSAAMSPVIKTTSGTAIYGHVIKDYNLVTSKGMVGYAKTTDATARVGTNPLIVKAVSLLDFNRDPVVSNINATQILKADRETHFLDNLMVVFVK